MSEWDDEDTDNAPDSEKPGPTYRLTIDGLPQSAIMNAVLERVARDVAGQITNDQRHDFRMQVLQKLSDKEMQNVIESFRKTVRERFDAKLAADVAETLKSAIGLR